MFLPGLPLHQGKHRQDVATYLVPGVASRPGGSSGRLQDKKNSEWRHHWGGPGVGAGKGHTHLALKGAALRDGKRTEGHVRKRGHTAMPAARAQSAGGGTGDGDARVGDTGGGKGLTTCSTLFF